MANPVNPHESPGVPDGSAPLDDPLLDAIERSIEDPSGLTDPLLHGPHPGMDDLAFQLDQVEASIEGAPHIVPGSGPAPDEVEMPLDAEDLSGLDAGPFEEAIDALLGSAENPEILEDSHLANKDGWVSRAPDDRGAPRGSSHPRSRSGRGRAADRRVHSGMRSRAGRFRPRGRTGIRIVDGSRICPECHELMTEEDCRECDKYRHWPEGTEEEPRECWYDWQERQSFGCPGEGGE